MIVAVLVQVIARVKQLFYFPDLFLRVADLVVDDAGRAHDLAMVETAIVHVGFLRVSRQVVELVDVDAVARVADDLGDPAFALTLNKVADKFLLFRLDLGA